MLLAFALRVYRLDAQSLWYDEAVTAQVAAKGIAELTRWTADDIQPPLYYYLVAGWTRLAGRGEWALRFPSAFFGTATVALLWALARRLFGLGEVGRWAAGIVAWLAATSPLYVYYAQEARMYTLLTFWGVLAGYALLRAGQIADRKSQIANRWWLVFVLASTAMLYTHYFGVFLLVAYGVCVTQCALAHFGHVRHRFQSVALPSNNLGWLAQTFRVCETLKVFGAFLAIALLYLPWLPAMLTRYRVDRSYWGGALKLDEALRHVAISFTTGAPEMMLESMAVRWLPILGAAFAVAAAALLWRRRTAGAAATLLLVLVVPVLAVLMLASRTPKFNPRYLMLASPAYFLILAGGVAMLTVEHGARRRPATSLEQHGAVLLLIMIISFALFVPPRAIESWFTNPAFTKAQWREVAAAVRQERAPDEAVLLVSGHAYPAWDYYAADIPAVRLPEIDILDVDATIGFETGATLAQALAGKRGAWLVTWQDDVVDPVGFAPYFLDRAGVEQAQPVQAWHIGLRHWQLTPDATFPTEPQPQHVAAANYAHKLALLGWDDPQRGEITVYWRALNTLERDYQVSLVLEDAAGRQVGRWDGRPAGYDYPTTRWRPGQALFGRYPLSLPQGLPPGDFSVTLAVYDPADPAGLDLRDVADNPAGKRVRLGPLRLGE